MDLGIRGRTALVAGASAGLGKCAAMALAQEGGRIVISARGEERLLATAQEIRDATGAEVTAIVANHATDAGRQALQAACPSPDFLIFTFSPPPMEPDYRRIDAGQWRQAFEEITIGSIELMRHYAEAMSERGFGRIINLSTIAAKYPLAIRTLSGATRAAVGNYAVSLARVVAKNNVAINAILPGMFETPGLAKGFAESAARRGTTPEQEREAFLKPLNIPRRTLGEAEDVGALCAFLCSRFGSYIVGQSILVDGGLGAAIF